MVARTETRANDRKIEPDIKADIEADIELNIEPPRESDEQTGVATTSVAAGVSKIVQCYSTEGQRGFGMRRADGALRPSVHRTHSFFNRF
jgi:hypothetical protein